MFVGDDVLMVFLRYEGQQTLGIHGRCFRFAKVKNIKSFFEKALPDYDRNRFYVSHMKKVVDWYNALKKYASLDFSGPDEEDTETSGSAEEKQK